MLAPFAPPLAEIALNSEPVKYAILALTSPLWIPFFKALWNTLDDGLREEGGLLGHPPTEDQLLELERERGPAAATLISVPKEGPVDARGPGDKAHEGGGDSQRRASRGRSGGSPPGGRAGSRGGEVPGGPRRTGFR